MIKILNCYSGIGGNRKLWPDNEIEVTAVEYNEKIAKIYQDYFPQDKMIIADAHQYLLEHYKEYDFIWSSPPCPTHSRLNTMLNKNGINRYPDMTLYQEIIFLKHWYYNKFVIENVIPYYEPLIPGQKRGRHLYWSNFYIAEFKKNDEKIHTDVKATDTIYGFNISRYELDNDYNHVKVLNNMVNPELGLHIFNCAYKIIQLSLFEK